MSSPYRVFISYTHDSDAHKDAVLRFGMLLRSCGIDAEVDRWATDERRDWYLWMIEAAKLADFIIVIASAVYRRVGDGEVSSTDNRGSQG